MMGPAEPSRASPRRSPMAHSPQNLLVHNAQKVNFINYIAIAEKFACFSYSPITSVFLVGACSFKCLLG